MSETPPPSDEPSWPCERCAWPINDAILSDTPDCPHGWLSLEGMAMADIKAMFAAGAPELSLDPVAADEPRERP